MKKLKKNPMYLVAGVVGVIALVILVTKPNQSKKTAKGTISSDGIVSVELNEDGYFAIQEDEITEKATFYEYELEGTTVSFFAVKASDGTVRTAFNTCQVCYGSPYAYFTQEESVFTCNNCGNRYNQDMIEQERGGCNPIPISADEKSIIDNEIRISEELLEYSVPLFKNWKKFQ